MEHDAKRERLSQQAFIAQDRDPFCQTSCKKLPYVILYSESATFAQTQAHASALARIITHSQHGISRVGGNVLQLVRIDKVQSQKHTPYRVALIWLLVYVQIIDFVL